ncbi:MAG: hypothetical protein ACWGOX_11065 [Desulforhopalus sp.]
MSTLTMILIQLDPWFIAPYRWISPASAGFLLGTTLLALQCVFLGDIAASLVTRINRKYLRKLQTSMDRHHALSEEALKRGDKESFKAVNKQAMDAFGHSFSFGAAIFCVSIWPMPFALAWMSSRFANTPLELPFNLPFLGNSVEFFPFFLLLYIAIRVSYGSILSRCSWYRRLKDGITGHSG